MEVIYTTKSIDFTIGILVAIVVFGVLYLIKWFKDKKNRKGLYFAIIIVSLVIGLGAGYWSGAANASSLVKGDFSSHTCVAYGCNNPSIYKVTILNGGNEYYCSNHYNDAVTLYNTYAGYSKSSGKSSGSSAKDKYGHDKFDAIVIAEKKVKEKLKSPTSAKFSNESASLSGDTWTVTGNVDAQNSFGATIRNKFTVTITFSSSTKYTSSCSIS